MTVPTVEQFLNALIQEPHDDVEYETKKWKATTYLIQVAQDWQTLVMDQELDKDVRLRAAQCAGCIRRELAP